MNNVNSLFIAHFRIAKRNIYQMRLSSTELSSICVYAENEKLHGGHIYYFPKHGLCLPYYNNSNRNKEIVVQSPDSSSQFEPTDHGWNVRQSIEREREKGRPL